MKAIMSVHLSNGCLVFTALLVQHQHSLCKHSAMAQRRCLEDSLRWRAIGRIEARQLQADMVKWLNVHRSVVSWMWKQFVESDDEGKDDQE